MKIKSRVSSIQIINEIINSKKINHKNNKKILSITRNASPNTRVQKLNFKKSDYLAMFSCDQWLGGIDLKCLSPFCWHTCCPTVNSSQYVRLYDNQFNRKIPAIWLQTLQQTTLRWDAPFFRRMSNWIDLQLIMELWIWWSSLWHLFFRGSVLWWSVTWASFFTTSTL